MTIYFAGISDKPEYPGQYFNIAKSKKMPYPRLECLAPMWYMVQDHQVGLMDDKIYIDVYLKLMNERRKEVKALFDSLKPDEDQCWLCFCHEYESPEHEILGKKKFCHRRIVAKMLKSMRPDIPIEVH